MSWAAIQSIGKIDTLPPISMNLKFLTVGSAAALAITVTDIPLEKASPNGELHVIGKCNRVHRLIRPTSRQSSSGPGVQPDEISGDPGA